MTDQARQRLARAFRGVEMVEFAPSLSFRHLVRPGGRIIVAGGDGTVSAVARALAGTDRVLGVISLGTYNNFAGSLGLPAEIDAAIRAVKAGRPRAVTLGAVGEEVFLEAAGIGFFGGAIALGEAAKEAEFGAIGRGLRALSGVRPFEYRLEGDLVGGGRALSLVFANTPSTGVRLQIATTPPTRPFLEFAVHVGGTRRDILRRALTAATGLKAKEPEISLRFTRLEIVTRPRVAVYADDRKVGRTPVTVSALARALRVLLPPRPRDPTR